MQFTKLIQEHSRAWARQRARLRPPRRHCRHPREERRLFPRWRRSRAGPDKVARWIAAWHEAGHLYALAHVCGVQARAYIGRPVTDRTGIGGPGTRKLGMGWTRAHHRPEDRNRLLVAVLAGWLIERRIFLIPPVGRWHGTYVRRKPNPKTCPEDDYHIRANAGPRWQVQFAQAVQFIQRNRESIRRLAVKLFRKGRAIMPAGPATETGLEESPVVPGSAVPAGRTWPGGLPGACRSGGGDCLPLDKGMASDRLMA